MYICLQGFSVGIGLTYPICGFIIDKWGWRIVFYTTGTIGLSWCVLWYFLAYNTPEDHPRISCKEYNFIQQNIDSNIKEGFKMKVPWMAIFTSMPAWSIGITTFGRIWVHYTFIMFGPMYMKNILGFNIKENGLLSGTPFLCSYLSSVVFCWLADYMVKTDFMTLTNVRKVFTASSQVVPGILVLFINYFNTNLTIILINWFVAITMITAAYAGAMASIVDIAPNLAGPVLAFAQTIHMSASFINPFVNGYIMVNSMDLAQWNYVFILTSIVACSTYIVFQIYGTADIQPWNYPPKKLETDNDCERPKHQRQEHL